MEQLMLFEGVSGSGKTTLKDPVHKARDWEDYFIHRLTATHYVYARLNNRPVDVDRLRSIEEQIMGIWDTLVVWCRPSPDVARMRKEMIDSHVYEKSFAVADEAFAEYFHSVTRFKRILELRTDVFTIDQCVDKIVEELASHD